MRENIILVHRTPILSLVAILEEGSLQELYIERAGTQGLVGNIHKGRVTRVLPGMEAAFVDIGLERAGYLHFGELMEWEGETIQTKGRNLKVGDEVVVQIIKAPIGTKGARLTEGITFPGRYLVLVPYQKVIGVSRRIRSSQERYRLKKLLKEIVPEGMGLIARTNAERCKPEDLKSDLNYLLRVFRAVKEREETTSAPSLLYEEPPLSIRILRDALSPQYEKILVDNREEYEKILKFLKNVAEDRIKDLIFYEGTRPMIEVYEVDKGIRNALKPTITLPSGGTIVIEETEALTSVDVNTGSFVGRTDLEETVFKTNMEAVQEIARQIRLRNIGGLIIIDFIDMDIPENRNKVHRAFREALKKDRAKVLVQKVNEFGLLEMTRERLYESLTRSIGEKCSHCLGKGYRIRPWFLISEIYKKIEENLLHKDVQKLNVYIHPYLATPLLEEYYPYFENLMESHRKEIRFIAEPSLKEDQYEIVGEKGKVYFSTPPLPLQRRESFD